MGVTTIPKFKIGEYACFYCRFAEDDEEDRLHMMRIVAMRFSNGWKYDLEGSLYEVENMPEGRLKKVIV